MIRPNFHQEFLQASPEWALFRCGWIGGSVLEDVLSKGKSGEESAGRKKLRFKKAIERETRVPSPEEFKTQAMINGTEREPFGRVLYEEKMGVIVEQFGFIEHPKIPWFGVSPDGIRDEVPMVGGVEIKSPEFHTHCQTLITQTVPRGYWLQCLGLMECAALEFVDYVSFHPDFPEGDPRRLFIKRIYRDEAQIREIKTEVERLNDDIEETRIKLRAIENPVYLERS
jgi:hypothetical protein